MAYEYDQLGNIIGEYESEEERRLREAANQPVKQTTVYNPDGTSEVTIKGTPEALSSANPNTPTLTSPVSPDEVYKRMLQAESGNRDYTKSGQPVTSPKGAMFASQVMPATAANPGYGVRPAQSQTPEEYNRVGREYYQALLKQFGGDTQKAAAAYNAGPGRVQQNIRQNQGQMNVGQLPQETQGYLQKIGQTVGNMIPSAQASTMPQSPANVGSSGFQPYDRNRPGNAAYQGAPVAEPFQGQTDEFGGMEERSKYALGTGQGNQGIKQQPIGQAPTAGPVFDFYQQFQDNPRALISMAYTNQDVGVPDWMRDRMKNRASELITQQRELENAKGQIPTMSESDIAKMLREKTTGGNYLKAAFFGLIGMENSAMAEAAKLGIGKETMTQINGQPAMVKIAANGTPIDGYNAVTGKKLSAEELVIATQFGTTQKGTEVEAGTYMDPSGKVAGNWVLERRPGGSQYRQVGTGKIATEEQANSLRKTGVQGTLTDQRARTVQDINLKLQGKGVEEQMRILSAYNSQLAGAGLPIVQPSEVGINVPQVGSAPATTGTTGAPVSPAASAAAAPRPTAAELGARKDIVTDAAKQVAASADTQNMLNSINKITGLLDSGEHNVGSALSGFAGRGPIAQAIGSQFETVDAKNTKTILDTVNKLAADGLKALGSNPSTPDLLFWTKYKPDGSSDPAFVKDWIQSRSDDLKRRLGYATSQVGAGGGAGTAPEANVELTAQQKAKLELERRKKKD